MLTASLQNMKTVPCIGRFKEDVGHRSMTDEALYHCKKSKIYYVASYFFLRSGLAAYCIEPPGYFNFRNYFRVTLIDYIEYNNLRG